MYKINEHSRSQLDLMMVFHGTQPAARSQRVSIARRWQDSTVAMLRLVDGQWQWQRTTATDDDNGNGNDNGKGKGKRKRG